MEKPNPTAFLCHATEDKPLARKIALTLQENGIHTFFDEWEIRLGDSLRRKIDEGLELCTHFIPLLTPNSIDKPWVKEELDAAFIQKVEGKCKFFPLLNEIQVQQLPPLLRSILCLDLKNDPELQKLISDILELSIRPPLGTQPLPIQPVHFSLGLTPIASTIIEYLVKESKNGISGDPQISAEDLISKLSRDDLGDSLLELKDGGFIQDIRTMCDYPGNFLYISPTNETFVEFDSVFMNWNPEKDAIHVAIDLINNKDENVENIGNRLGWPPRRLNPAVNYLINNKIVETSRVLGVHPYTTLCIYGDHNTRRFVKENN